MFITVSMTSAHRQVDTRHTKGMLQLPEHWFFGREVAAAGREYLRGYRLPERRYLGPTSMDAEMAFLMCNHALAGFSCPPHQLPLHTALSLPFLSMQHSHCLTI